MDTYDVVVLGGGSGGEAVATALGPDMAVAVVEGGLVGGECPFTACMPSKAMLHDAAVGRGWDEAVARRDEVVQHRDDEQHAQGLRDAGVALVRGRGTVTGPGRLAVALADGGERELGFTHLVLATGADAVLPPIDGLDDVEAWTSDDLWVATERPDSLVSIGGGAIGLEAATALAGFGTDVTVLDMADALVPPVPGASDLVREGLAARGVDVHLGVEVASVARGDDGGVVVALADGAEVAAERLLVAAGKAPRVAGIGLEALGLDPDAFEVGDDGRVAGATGVWAVGDVSGHPPYTHTANALGSAVAENVRTGGERSIDPDATPQTIFTDPPVAFVGDLAPSVPHVLVTATYDDIARPATDETGPGTVSLAARSADGVVLGIGGVGAHVDELVHGWTIAVAARLDVGLLSTVQQQFPTHGEITKLLAQQAADAIG